MFQILRIVITFSWLNEKHFNNKLKARWDI